MNILFRLQQAFDSPLGDLLIFLVIITLTLSFFYLYFLAKFKRNRSLLFKYHAFFKKVEKQYQDISFLEGGSGDFFGKQQTIALSNGQFGKATIFYPDLVNEQMQRRLNAYQIALRQSDSQAFPKQVLYNDVVSTLLVDFQYSKRDASSLVRLDQLLQREPLTDLDKEFFLVNLMHTLAALHDLQTENLEKLYHGFLLPISFYVSLDMVKRISSTFLAHHGCVFAMGTHAFKNWYSAIHQNEVRIDPYLKETLEDFAFIFSPEQREGSKALGPESDFYSFAALAIYLFTERTYAPNDPLPIDALPKAWQPFIQSCLSINPEDRPYNFLELKEYLNHPDFSLVDNRTLSFISHQDIHSHKLETEHSLKFLFDQIQKIKVEDSPFDETWHLGYLAIKKESWDEAFLIFQQMMKNDHQAFNAHLGLSLTYFKKGEQDKAKFHYLQAKKIDGKKISSFHRLIAFDV